MTIYYKRETMEKQEALKKLNDLIEDLKNLPSYNKDGMPEYSKWYRKIKRTIEKIFGEASSHLYDLERMKFEHIPFNQAFDNINKTSGEENRFHKLILEKISLIESLIEEVEEWEDNTARTYSTTKLEGTTVTVVNIKDTTPKTKVFIVHGHDKQARLEIARFLEKLDIEAIMLDEQASGNNTIIEKIEEYSSQVGFGIVLYTECDIGGKDENSLQPRARQNVVFEHGYLVAKLGRENVCQIKKGNVETPGDVSGVVYITMNSDSWHLPLAKELKKAGYNIDLNKLY